MGHRALCSVWDKRGLADFARGIEKLGWTVISTGGTARELGRSGVAVREVSQITGFPEILGGRVKTLHPRIHGGILACRDSESHVADLREHRIEPIDLVVVNLYPFAETVRAGGSIEEAVEQIDIGGPTLLRAAAKNFRDVAVVVDPSDYGAVLEELQRGLSLATRLRLARKAFAHVTGYDSAIAEYFSRLSVEAEKIVENRELAFFPGYLGLELEKVASLRYGENPHQRAAVYRMQGERAGVVSAEQIQGKELSYNNYLDLSAAWDVIREFSEPAACIIKHTNPCGVAIGSTLEDAYAGAYETDPISAFGSVIGFNRGVDRKVAEAMAKTFVEAILAPDYDPGALDVLKAKKNLRIMRLPWDAGTGTPVNYRSISGGMLVQDADRYFLKTGEWKSVGTTELDPTLAADLGFAWKVVKHVKSNAIVLARDGRTLGVGAGQMSRVDSVRIAIQKAVASLRGSVMASDAFFPFRDSLDEAARAGIRAVIEPGGSIRDDEVIAAANEHRISLVFTGIRHFRH